MKKSYQNKQKKMYRIRLYGINDNIFVSKNNITKKKPYGIALSDIDVNN